MKINSSWNLFLFPLLAMLQQAELPPTPQQGKHAPYPEPAAGYVTDLANLLDRDQEEVIEQWLWKTEAETGVEIAVVTINSIRDYPGAKQNTIESFARGMFDKYGIGNLPKNDGVLLLVARNDRKARIELGKGYGRQRDQAATRIMENRIIPKFKQDKYADGITAGVKGIMLEFASIRVGWNWPLILSLLAVPILGLITYSLFKNGKRGWGWICVGILIIVLLAIVRMVYVGMRNLPDSSSDSWSSGGFGGGFGGGSSGGGGATGSW